MHGTTRFDSINLIADPLYGYIEITKGGPGQASESVLLDTPWLQRLRRVRQLQSAWWIFPTAEHSRFTHLLGAMHLATQFSHSLDTTLRAAFDDAPSPACVEETLRLASLLHDVGHGPFGHFFDQHYLKQYGIDHEDIGRYLITGPLAGIIGDIRSSPSGDFAAGERVDPRWVAWIIAPTELPGYEAPAWLRACQPVLCGPATVDNLDYVRRDAYMCGVPGAVVDWPRIVHYSFVHGDSMVLHANAVPALEMFLTARLYMYTQVYLHRTGRRFDLSMREIFADTIRTFLSGNPLDDMDEYLDLTDWSVLERANRWTRATPGTAERALGDRWARIMARDLPWKLVYETIVKRGVDLAALQKHFADELPSHVRADSYVVDVTTTSIAPNNPMTDDGMVAIYDPLQHMVEHSRTAELVARLPQYNQLVRIFSNDASATATLQTAARRLGLAPGR
jgi:HD superfamily phosphohydrolase